MKQKTDLSKIVHCILILTLYILCMHEVFSYWCHAVPTLSCQLLLGIYVFSKHV